MTTYDDIQKLIEAMRTRPKVEVKPGEPIKVLLFGPPQPTEEEIQAITDMCGGECDIYWYGIAS